MELSRASLTAYAKGDAGKKWLKYSAVSVVNVVVGSLLLLFAHAVLGWSYTVSNVFAVSIGAVPGYFFSRYWVWQKSGKNHLVKEVLPFWTLAFLGLLISTAAAAKASDYSDSSGVLLLVNLGSFGVLWIIKFFVLDSVLFGTHHHGPAVDETPDELGDLDATPVGEAAPSL